ncbi:MAG TPA: PepSY domain-containing protein [Alphaproteobacteria bacterium]|jgi:hypothetical protein
MKRFMISAAATALLLGTAGMAMADDDSGDKAQQMQSATEVQTLLQSKGYSQVNSVRTGNADGKVHATAVRNGKPVNVEIDMNTGSVIETSH